MNPLAMKLMGKKDKRKPKTTDPEETPIEILKIEEVRTKEINFLKRVITDWVIKGNFTTEELKDILQHVKSKNPNNTNK